MTEVEAPQIPLPLSYKCFVNLRSFILVILKYFISFNNPQHFCVFLSLSRSLSGQLLLLVFYYLYFSLLFLILKMINAKLERCMAGSHALLYEISAFIYTSRRPTRCVRNFDMIIFYWIIIELIYQIVYYYKFNMCYLYVLNQKFFVV